MVDYDNQLVENLPKPVYTLEQAKNSVAIKRCFHKTKKVTNDTCVIVSNEDFMCNWTYNQLKKYGFTEIYFMSEWNKRTIPYKMTPRCKENFWLEVNVADHCNLNCQCCDHFAPIADKYLLDIDEFERDMNRLAELMDGKMGIFKIQGGEPTLHPQLIDFMRITREKFPTSTIFFFTNGILLLSLEKGKNGNLWQAMKDYDVTLMITTYPLNIDFEKLDAKAKEYGLKYERFVEVGKVDPHAIGENKYYGKDIDKLSVHHPFDLKGKVPKYEYVSCYQFNESITLRHGKIYTCPFIPSKIHNLILIGGEPLLVKNLNEFLEFVATKRKIKNIYIVSNGTLVPSDKLISAMKKYRKKFTYWLSDYSGNEKLQPILKKEQIFNILNKHKIKYVFNESLQWNACSPPKDNKRSREDIIAYYKRCLHPCLSVISGKLTQCPRTSTYLTLGMLPSNILSLDLKKNIKKKDLYEFYNNDYYPSCNYCNFHEDFLLPKVIPAIQKR